jgi:hypothetical protein
LITVQTTGPSEKRETGDEDHKRDQHNERLSAGGIRRLAEALEHDGDDQDTEPHPGDPTE